MPAHERGNMNGGEWREAFRVTLAALGAAGGTARGMPLHRALWMLWFPAGFVAFLDQVGTGNLQFASRLAGGDEPIWERQLAWVDLGGLLSNWVEAAAESPHSLVVSVFGALLAVVLGMTLITGAGSLGQLMFVRLASTRKPAVFVHARGAWPLVRSLWLFRLALFAVSFVLFIPFFITGMLWMAQAGSEGVDSWGQLARIVGPLAAVWTFIGTAFLAINGYTRNIVVPIMDRRACECLDAWGEGLALLRVHWRPLLLFFILQMLIFAVFTAVSYVVSFMLCCIGFIPIVHHIIFVPYYLFDRSFGVELLARLDASLAPPIEGEMG